MLLQKQPTQLRLTQAERRTKDRVQGLWQRATDGRHPGSRAGKGSLDGTWSALDAAVRRDPLKRTQEDIDLLKAWLSGLKMSRTIELDMDIVCRVVRVSSKAVPVDEVLAATGDAITAMHIVYKGELAAYTITDEEGNACVSVSVCSE